jgi:hypothetical protein
VSNRDITYIVVGCCGVFIVAAYVAFLLVPAWTAYTRIWQRLAATLLSLYVLAAFVAVGAAGGGAIVWFWDRIGV